MLVYAKTDIGKAREMNQDFIYVSNNLGDIKLCILADGMGGYKGGEIASSLATLTAKEYIEKNINNIELEYENILDLIKKAMEYANLAVHQKGMEIEELEQMGTTLEICLVYNNKMYIGHIGDSRIYRIRKNIIRRITTDHSYVETLVKDGTITREEAFYHPKKNMLIKALGCTENIEPDITIKEFLPGDEILMCSDGLTNMLKEDEIYNIIKEDEENACSNLISKANERGGLDNISVILISSRN
ncbi:MAG: Stp1/IreP family PP2C-type Ser/Thr phosphatase [Clostridia bacterium]|nr:Stp1/IreP family PP2C-type Ser/Thr phosphatase [Clostridia bacterium]